MCSVSRFLVALPSAPDLLLCAKDLFVAARTCDMDCRHHAASTAGSASGGLSIILRVLVMLGLGRDRHRRQNQAQGNASDHGAKQ